MKNTTQAPGAPVGAPGTLDELKKLLQDFDTAMLTTVTPHGLLRARPMAVQKPVPELACDLWFVTAVESPKAGEIAHEEQVGVSCYRHEDRAYISISASARVRRDRTLVEKLFQPSWKVWFPDGPSDPSIAFIEMQVERAEYWNLEGGRVRLLYEMAKSLVRGESAVANLPPPKKI